MTALLVDVGNSRIKWRVADAAPAFATLATGNIGDLGAALAHDAERARPDQACISCVAGAAVLASVVAQILSVWPRLRIDPLIPKSAEAGVINGYQDPSRLGPDRWAALIGAHGLWPADALLVCSFGTATTIDLLLPANDRADASFVGGAILPGFALMRRALATDTARLDVAPGDAVDFAERTEDAIATGILLAQTGAVVAAWSDAQRRLVDRPDARLRGVLAGGDAGLVAPRLARAGYDNDVVADLVLRGLAVIASGTARPTHSTT